MPERTKETKARPFLLRREGQNNATAYIHLTKPRNFDWNNKINRVSMVDRLETGTDNNKH